MNINEYQEKARTTRSESIQNNLSYSALGLTGEAGEVADKVKKILRGDFQGDPERLDAHKMEIAKEIGDVLWYLAAVADDLGVHLDVIAQSNLDKLSSRQQRGEIKGSGDNR